MTTNYTRSLTEDQITLLQSLLTTEFNRPGKDNPTEEATDILGCRQALRSAVPGEARHMPIICTGWNRRAADLGLPKKGARREADREAYMQGALAALTVSGLMPVERANQIGFLCAVGRLAGYMDQQAAKDAEVAA